MSLANNLLNPQLVPLINKKAPPRNAHFRKLYNTLVEGCWKRGFGFEIPRKKINDEILQSDLNLIRRHVQTAASELFFDPREMDLNLSNPFSAISINDNNGFLVMPGIYTSTGKNVYRSNVPGSDLDDIENSTIPVLEEHFKDLEAVLNLLQHRKCDFDLTMTVTKDDITLRTYFSNGELEEQTHHVSYDKESEIRQEDWNIDYRQMDIAKQSEAIVYTLYYAKFDSNNNLLEWDSYQYENDIYIDIDKIASPAILSTSPEADAWSEKFFIQPTIYIEDKIILSKPTSQYDEEKNGIAKVDCDSCCNLVRNPTALLADMTHNVYGRINDLLTLSSITGYGIQIAHYMTSYDYDGTKYGQYNCNTRFEQHFQGFATDENQKTASWEFFYLRRPGGALVPFYWKNNTGLPLNNYNYRIYKENGNLCVKFKDGIIQVFENSYLVKCRYSDNVNRLSMSLPGLGITWSNFDNNRYSFQNANIAEDTYLNIINAGKAYPYECRYSSTPIFFRTLAALSAGNDIGELDDSVSSLNDDMVFRVTSSEAFEDTEGFGFADFFPESESPDFGEAIACDVRNYFDKEERLIAKYIEMKFGENIMRGYWRRLNTLMKPAELVIFERNTLAENKILEKRTDIKFGNDDIRYDAVSYKLKKKFPFGEEIIAEYRKYGTPEQTESIFTYDDNPTSNAYGQLIFSRDFNGAWARYEYDLQGRLVKEVTPFADSPEDAPENSCQVVTYDYALLHEDESFDPADNRARTVITYNLGTETSREYHLYFAHENRNIIATAPGAAWDAETNLVTRHLRYAEGDFTGRNWKTINPDGSTSEITYVKHNIENPGTAAETFDLETVTESGYLPNHGIRTITMHNKTGKLLSRRVYDIASELLISGSDYTYDDYGRVSGEITIDGDTTATVYNCCGPRFVTAPDGSITEYAYDVFNRQIFSSNNGITYITIHDAVGNAIEIKTIGKDGGELITRNEYDSDSRLIREFNAANVPISYYYDKHYTEITDVYGGNVVVENYLDGRTKSVNGSASNPKSYKYGIENGELYTLECSAGEAVARTYTDFMGREYKRIFSDGFSETTYYDFCGRVSSQVNSDGKKLLYFYDENTGSLKYQVSKRLDNSNDIDWTNDHIIEFEHGYHTRSDMVLKYQKTFMYKDNRKIEISSNQSNRKNTERWLKEFGVTTHIEKESESDGTTWEKITKPNGNILTNYFKDGKLIRKSDPILGNIEYIYDEFYRFIGEDHEVNGELVHIRHTLDEAGMPVKITQSSNEESRSYFYAYDLLGHMLSETTPEGITKNYSYTAKGQVAEVSGAAWHQEYQYDNRGLIISLITGNNENSAQVTTFEYDIHGRVVRKTYPDNTTEEYTYLGDGRISSRTNARKHVHYYQYNYAGELTGIYSESGINRGFEYDQYGRLIKVSDNCGNYFMSYDDNGRLISETPPHLDGVSVGWSYDDCLRPAVLSIGDNVLASYGYGGDGRLSSIAHGARTLEYDYIPGTYQVQSKNWQNHIHGSLLRTEYFYDKFSRLTEIRSNGLPEVSYRINADDLRIASRIGESCQWDYIYDAKGQLIEAKQKNTADDILASMSYAYDGIGNRAVSFVNSNATSYAPNSLNQYTLVNELPLSYDYDGNMLAGDNWTYHWDTENRLVGAENGEKRLEYVYDFMGRMIIRRQFNASSENWLLDHTEKYLYDGWNRIGEFNAENELTRSYLWGNDVNGIPHGAAGIGGLLAEIHPDGKIYLPVYDGNSNITSYLDADNGATVANYTYSPFGDLLNPDANTGLKYRFSTKAYDDLAGIYYYGLRHYDPGLGRWLSRDPIGENGGLNLYAMVANNPVNYIDLLGEALYAFDGTANWEDHYTNVFLMHEAYQSEHKRYYRGIGNDVDYDWMPLTRTTIKALGLTMNKKVEEALADLRNNLNGKNKEKRLDCDVDVIGFSRGGIIAVKFAEKIAELKKANDSDIRKINDIRFVGLFDPVVGGLKKASHKQMDAIVTQSSVAYSINEERNLFAPTYYTGSNVNAMFFLGGHSDIGGGYADRGLANITLEWMVSEGKSAGAPFELKANFYSQLYQKSISEGGTLKMLTNNIVRHQERPFYSTYSPRALPAQAQYHYSVWQFISSLITIWR